MYGRAVIKLGFRRKTFYHRTVELLILWSGDLGRLDEYGGGIEDGNEGLSGIVHLFFQTSSRLGICLFTYTQPHRILQWILKICSRILSFGTPERSRVTFRPYLSQ